MTSRKKPGLYGNIHAKQQRIAHGSGEHMRKLRSAGASSEEACEKAAKTDKASKAKARTRAQ